jgi:homoserine kinase
MKQAATAFAPATVANVGCGYDIFGFAIDEPGDIVKVSRCATRGVQLTKITGDGGQLPKDAPHNTAGFAVIQFLKKIGIQQGIQIELYKQLPLSSGMGSSAASSVAALVAINRLYDNPLSKEELLPIAISAEKVACGTAHADNVAPALLGGFVLIRANEPPDIVELPVPEQLICTVIHPAIAINTVDARKILEPFVPLPDAVKQWANTAGLVAALFKNDMNLLSRSLSDHIIEPRRAALIPHFYEVQQAALTAGALGCSISGSGPSIFALSESRQTAQQVAVVMEKIVHTHQIDCHLYISPINKTGSRIIDT